MMDLRVVGKSEFMGKELKIIEGGFGENCRVMTTKQIAEIHNMENFNVVKLINNNIDEFEVGVDINEIKAILTNDSQIAENLNYSKDAINASKNIYILSEQGYMALVGLMRNEDAREIRKKIRREYFAMRKIINSDEQLLSKLVLDIYNGGQNAVLSARQLTEIEVNKATKPLLETIEVQKPLVNFADKLLKSKENILIGDFAKAIYTDGVNLGQNKLFSWLRDNDYLYKKGTDNFPYQKYIDNGLFVLKERIVDTVYNNKTIIKFTTLITPTGQLYFYNKLKKEFGDDK